MAILNPKDHSQFPRVERTSTRLKKDILLTTEDRNLQMSKKRNLEGTNLNYENPFSILPNNVIINLSRIWEL